MIEINIFHSKILHTAFVTDFGSNQFELQSVLNSDHKWHFFALRRTQTSLFQHKNHTSLTALSERLIKQKLLLAIPETAAVDMCHCIEECTCSIPIIRLEISHWEVKDTSFGAQHTSLYDQYNLIQCIELITCEMSNAAGQKTTDNFLKESTRYLLLNCSEQPLKGQNLHHWQSQFHC